MPTISTAAALELVGTELGVSDWYLIDQEMVNKFADITNDHQFIHVNPEAAAKTPFGGTIVHGFFTLSMLAGLPASGSIGLEGVKMGVNYGIDKVRFLEPVRVGSRVRARHKLKALEEKSPGRWLFTTEVTIEIEGKDKPALIADWLTMQFVG